MHFRYSYYLIAISQISWWEGTGSSSPCHGHCSLLRWGPWCLSSSMSADLEVGLVWVLGCPGIIAMKRWGCSPSRSGAHLHHCLLCESLNELVSQYSFIKTVRFSPALHRSSDTPLPPLEPLLPRTKNKKPHIPLEGRRWVVQYVYVWARFVSRWYNVISNNLDH